MTPRLKALLLGTGMLASLGWSGSAQAACSTATATDGPTNLTCPEDTTTTATANTNQNNPATSAREQVFNNTIFGRVNNGVTVNGFGLHVTATGTQAVGFENNGTVINNSAIANEFDIVERGLQLRSNGGDVTYTGNGSVRTTNPAVALHLFTRNLGNISVGSAAAPVTGNFDGRTAVSLNQGVTPGGTAADAPLRSINAFFHGGTFTVRPSEDVGVGIAISAQDAHVNLTMTGNSVISTANGAPGGGILINSLLVNTLQPTTVTVATDARIGTAAAPMQSGIAVFNFLDTTGLTNIALTGTGSIAATQWGILVDGSQAGSPVTVSTAAGTVITLAPAAGDVNTRGIEANTFGAGNLAIDVAGSISGGHYGIFASPENGRLDLTIQQGATVSGTQFGLDVNRFGGTGVENILVLGTLSSPQTAARFSGTLQVGNGGTSGALSGNVVNNGTLIFNRSDASALAGVVSGTGALRQAGTGTLTLSGASTYTGGTTVQQGTLLVNGSVVDATTVNIAGRLGGTGSIGSATVNGTLAPGSGGIGTLSTAGNVTFAAGSTFQVEVNEAGSGDRLAVGGIATLQGGTVSALFLGGESNRCGAPIQSTILTAQGGVSGTFAGVTANFAFLTPSLSYNANNVFLTLTRNAATFSERGATANQREAAAAAEALKCGNALFNPLVQLSTVAAQAAFEQISGEIHASARGALIDDSRFVRDALLSAPRDGGGVWASGYGSWGEIEGNGNAAALDRDSNGLFAGIDLRLAAGWTAGVGGGRSRADFAADARSSGAETRSWHAAAHVTGRFGSLRIAGGGAVSWHEIDTARTVAFTGFSDAPTARYDGRTRQAFAEVAYSLPMGAATLEPFAEAAWVDVETEAFAETGGASALTGRKVSDETTFTTLGLRGGVRFGTLSLSGSAGWRRAHGLDPSGTSLSFGAAGTPFTIAGAPIAKDALVAEAGAEIGLGGAGRLRFVYSGQIAGRSEDHGARATLSLPF